MTTLSHKLIYKPHESSYHLLQLIALVLDYYCLYIYSFFTSITCVMSQHGDTSTSNNTRQTQDAGSVQEETYGLQNEVVSKCIEIVQQFRTGEVSKPKASMLLFKAIPQQLEENTFVTAYGAYMGMLDNFERYRDGAARSGEQRISSFANTLDHTAAEEPGRQTPIAGPSKRAHSLESDSDDGEEYKKRTRLNYEALPWNETKGDETQRTTEV